VRVLSLLIEILSPVGLVTFVVWRDGGKGTCQETTTLSKTEKPVSATLNRQVETFSLISAVIEIFLNIFCVFLMCVIKRAFRLSDCYSHHYYSLSDRRRNAGTHPDTKQIHTVLLSYKSQKC
jgi:hypothetical protein